MEQEKLARLIEQSRTGDSRAQEELLLAIQNRVYYHCKKMLKKEEDAQDAAQEVLISVLTNLDQLQEPGAFWGWVNTITANRCRRMLSHAGWESQIPEDGDGNSLLDQMETLDEQTVPDKALDNAETCDMVLSIIDRLPPEQRMSVLFYYYDEMAVKDIAQAMDVSEGTVKSRLNYARKFIKTEVERLEKQGTKLYGVSVLPFLSHFLRCGAEGEVLSQQAEGALVHKALAAGASAVSGSAGAGAGAGAAAGGAAKGVGFFSTVAGKVTAAVVAGVIVVGGVVAVASNKPEEEPPETPAPIVETVEPEEPGFPACTAKQTVFEAENIYYYWETPVFDSDSEGYKAINRHYDDCIKDFADFFNGAIQGGCTILNRNLIEYNGSTTHIASRTDFKVIAQDERYVTIVSYSYDDCPYEGLEFVPVTYKTFDVETGRRVNLGDILDGTSEEIAAMIESKLEQDNGSGDADGEQTEHNLWNYDFYIENGQVWCSRKVKSTDDSPSPVLIAELTQQPQE